MLNNTSTPKADAAKTLSQLRTAIARRDWQASNELSHSVLVSCSDNPDAFELAARSAHGNGKLDVAADLMSDACRLESYSNAARLKQTVAALLATGRLHESIELLELAIAQQPNLHEIRQMLFQMCWGAEDRPRSLAHGRYLVRHRHFDLDLLLELSATESRTESSDSFIELATRHPTDKRPMIAEARIRFDQGHWDRAAETLRECLLRHPEDPPSLALLSRVLVDSGRYDEFVALAASAPRQTNDYPFFWIAKGDWCEAHQQPFEAARAYWEATQRDGGLRVAWLKLHAALKQIGPAESGLDRAQMDAIENRLLLLSRFSQSKAQLINSDTGHQKLAIEIAETAQELGQSWEAEAWASIATTMPDEGDGKAVRLVRQRIIDSLTVETPWQRVRTELELRLNPSRFPLPQFNRISVAAPTSHRGSLARSVPSSQIHLEDEAERRSLRSFGRTGDHLEVPGIKHFQTLGCGGGTIDYDLDGWSDLYLAAAGGTPPNRDSHPNTLWRNTSGRFQDVSLASKSGDVGFSQGIAVGDVNEDGFHDLVVLNYGSNALLINNGDGTFTDASERLGDSNGEMEWSSSGAIADLNDDGLADITVLTYGAGLEPVTRQCLQSGSQVARACSPLIFPGATDHFLYASGDGSFVDRTDDCGSPSVVGRGLGVIAGAFDAESRLGVFIANDLTSNHFWSRPINKSTLLQESGIVRGLGSDDRSPAQGSMGIAAGDFDLDGDPDLYVTNFRGEANTYHEQRDSDRWSDQTRSQKLITPTLPLVGFGTQAIDFDNNGIIELVVSNGHVDDYPGGISGEYAQPMQVFQRQVDQEFASVGQSIDTAYLRRHHVGRALWTIDVNRDGRTDLAVTHQTEPVALLVNQTESAGRFIEFRLVGRDCTRDAIGAVVRVKAGDREFAAFQTSGDGYLCSNERVLRVGLGGVADECSVSVTWPDGMKQHFAPVDAGTQWLLVQGERVAFELPHVHGLTGEESLRIR